MQHEHDIEVVLRYVIIDDRCIVGLVCLKSERWEERRREIRINEHTNCVHIKIEFYSPLCLSDLSTKRR